MRDADAGNFLIFIREEGKENFLKKIRIIKKIILQITD